MRSMVIVIFLLASGVESSLVRGDQRLAVFQNTMVYIFGPGELA
jgi:hypothetical protein